MFSRATLLDHNTSPCDEDFIPDTRGQTFLLFIHMAHHKDFTTWLQVAKVGLATPVGLCG